eukprot:6214110-Pleurochrysis_carterae.AAC.10
MSRDPASHTARNSFIDLQRPNLAYPDARLSKSCALKDGIMAREARARRRNALRRVHPNFASARTTVASCCASISTACDFAARARLDVSSFAVLSTAGVQ